VQRRVSFVAEPPLHFRRCRRRALTAGELAFGIASKPSAFAGSTITDKTYWPNEARQSAQARTGCSRGDLNSAFAYDRTPLRLSRRRIQATADRGGAIRAVPNLDDGLRETFAWVVRVDLAGCGLVAA